MGVPLPHPKDLFRKVLKPVSNIRYPALLPGKWRSQCCIKKSVALQVATLYTQEQYGIYFDEKKKKNMK